MARGLALGVALGGLGRAAVGLSHTRKPDGPSGVFSAEHQRLLCPSRSVGDRRLALLQTVRTHLGLVRKRGACLAQGIDRACHLPRLGVLVAADARAQLIGDARQITVETRVFVVVLLSCPIGPHRGCELVLGIPLVLRHLSPRRGHAGDVALGVVAQGELATRRVADAHQTILPVVAQTLLPAVAAFYFGNYSAPPW